MHRRWTRGVRIAAVALAFVGAVGCGDDEEAQATQAPEEGVRAWFDPTLWPTPGTPAGNWLAFPFPADYRRSDTGAVDLTGFPNPKRLPLIDSYVTTSARLDGYSTNGAVHVAFDAALDPTSLPTDLMAQTQPRSPIQLVNVTADSPEYGRRHPLRWEWRAEGGKYVPANSLAVAPAWGFPLLERTTYALLLTKGVRGADGRPLARPEVLIALLAGAAAPATERPIPEPLWAELTEDYAPVRALLARDGIEPSQVAVAVVFTTQSIMSPLRAVREQVQQGAAPALLDDWQTPEGGAAGSRWRLLYYRWSSDASTDYYVLEGRFVSKNYQEGTLPYTSSGGDLHFVDGAPVPVRDETLRFVLSLPRALPGSGCVPIVEVAHGTGGDAYSFVRDATAGRLAGRGLAGIGIDQPLHGLRKEGKTFDVGTASFNYLNPSAPRGNFRQSAIDTFLLTRFVRESLVVPAAVSPTGAPICFDPERVGFFGHSHGGLSGAIAAALERRVRSYVLSGAGGGLAAAAMQRKDLADIAAIISMAASLEATEPLSDLHPLMTLLQGLVEVTDPLNYARVWGDSTHGRLADVLLTSGEHDVATPHRTARALALAGRLPLVLPVVIPIPEYELLGWAPIPAPVSTNVAGRTVGFLQYTADLPGENMDTHFLAFYRPEAIHATMQFLKSSLTDGTAVIERPAAPDAL